MSGSTWDISTFIGNALSARSVYIVTTMHGERGRAGGAGCALIDIEGEQAIREAFGSSSYTTTEAWPDPSRSLHLTGASRTRRRLFQIV
jgi:hypothetical protein